MVARLHKGVYSCASELCTGVPTDAYVHYCLDRIALLLRNDVRPLMVFDGGYLPSKSGTEQEREKSVLVSPRRLLRSHESRHAARVAAGSERATWRRAVHTCKRATGLRHTAASQRPLK